MVAIVPGQAERSAGKEVNRDICIATLNVGAMRVEAIKLLNFVKETYRYLLCGRIKMEG